MTNDRRVPSELTPERRRLLARKGRILYGKACSPSGRGSCAESFVLRQLELGHLEVVRDLLQFLESQLDVLRTNDPDGLLSVTETLARRIRRRLLGNS
jgi:hypothetical protein